MRLVLVGAHLHREDIDGVAEPVACGEVWLSGIPLEEGQPLGDRTFLLEVARRRAALLDRATFVAIRYGFAASATDAASRCAPHAARWHELLERHRGEVEMTLKIAAPAARARPRREDFASGAGYLKALRASMAEVDDAFRAAVEQTIEVSASRWVHRGNASIEFAALVPRGKVDAVRSAGESLKERFPRVPFLLSGPWPLEVFAEAE